MLFMMLANHVYDGIDSLECAKDQESHRQSSQWTMEWCTCANMPRGRLGEGPTETRIVYRDILRDIHLDFCDPYYLTNHTSQPIHQEQSEWAHRL